MVAMFYRVIESDDDYNKVRVRFGDTTHPEAQLRALRYLGLKADFHTDGTPLILEKLISDGVPTPVGWLHKGYVTSPIGGGHWSVVIGFTDTHWIHNDPNGEALLISGGYTKNRNGREVKYSKHNWNKRWMLGGEKGWYLTARKT